MYSGEYDVCVATLSVYPHRASLKNMPGQGGIRTYTMIEKRIILLGYIGIEGTRLSSEISHTRTDLTA